MALQLEQREAAPDVTILVLTGRLELGDALAAAERTITKLVSVGRRKLVFDCSGLQSIDSAGMGMLLMCASSVRDVGGHLRLVAPPFRVTEVLRTARVLPVFDIDEDLETSLRRLEAQDEEFWFDESLPSER